MHFFFLDKLKRFILQLSRIKCSVNELDHTTRKAFWDDCAETNRIPALVILSMTLIMESFMVFSYYIRPFLHINTEFYPQYIYMYISMVILSASLLFLMKIFRTFPEILLKIELVMIAILSVWSSFFSAFDVMNGFSSYLFVQLTIIHSMIFRVKPIIHCMINLISYLIYTLLILMSHLSFIVTFAELINPFFMVVAACIMILLNIRIKCTSFLNQKLILEQNEKLELYANFDFLTNIPNRKSIIEYMDQIVLSDIKSIACLMIDIDNFKLYNDTYGHIKGDKCLCTVASVIEKLIISHDGKVGRYGGEEFLALLPNKDEDFIIRIANELVHAVKEANIDFPENRDYSVLTISIGVCIEENAGKFNKNKLLTIADNALYKAKKEGKNKCSIFHFD